MKLLKNKYFWLVIGLAILGYFWQQKVQEKKLGEEMKPKNIVRDVTIEVSSPIVGNAPMERSGEVITPTIVTNAPTSTANELTQIVTTQPTGIVSAPFHELNAGFQIEMERI